MFIDRDPNHLKPIAWMIEPLTAGPAKQLYVINHSKINPNPNY